MYLGMCIKIPSISCKMFVLILDSILNSEDNFKVCYQLVNKSTKQFSWVFFTALKFLCKKKRVLTHIKQFLSQSFEEMQVHLLHRRRSYAKKRCPTFNYFPAKKTHVIVVVRLIYVICTKDGGAVAR